MAYTPITTLLAAVSPDTTYYVKQETVPAIPTYTYTLPFTGKGGYIKSNKAVVVQFNSVLNDYFALPAKSELNLINFQITSIILSSVASSTTIEIFITGV